MKPQIAIIGPAGQEEYPKEIIINPSCYEYAYQLGKQIGQLGWTVVTGGKSGIMEEAPKGCKESGGQTVGIVSGNKRGQTNQFIDIEVVTNGYPSKEESTLIAMSDAIIMMGGGAGTLIELSIAYRQAKPIIIIKNTGGWADKISQPYLDERKRTKIFFVKSPAQAMKMLKTIMNKEMIK